MRRRFLHRQTVAALVVTATITVAAVAAVAGANPGDPRRAVRVDASFAKAAVSQLTHDQGDLRVIGLRDGAAHRYYEVQSATVDAAVDAYSGDVLALALAGDMPTTPTVVISDQDAVASALGYATATGLDVGGLQESVALIDHGDSKEYAVTWTEVLHGVRTPRSVRISVNPATGVVYAFLNFTRPYVDPPVPTITEAAAVEAACALLAAPDDAVATVTGLAITFDANGAQHLMYEVHLVVLGGFYTNVQVDAKDGRAVIITRG